MYVHSCEKLQCLRLEELFVSGNSITQRGKYEVSVSGTRNLSANLNANIPSPNGCSTRAPDKVAE